jgi:plasmid maintenance system antidote protein VapI
VVNSFSEDCGEGDYEDERTSFDPTALAERMNCTQQYVSKILKGTENLSLDTMDRLERALQINLIV